MKLTSQYPANLTWWMYNPKDSIHLVDYDHGSLATGQTVSLNFVDGQFQLKLTKSSGGATVYSPGAMFLNTDEYVFTAQAEFVSPADAATVEVGTLQNELFGTIDQFFDAASSSYQVKITTTVQQSTAQDGTQGTKISNQTSSQTGTKAGASVDLSQSNIPIKMSGEVSTQVQDKIAKEVSAQLKVNVSDTTTFTEDLGPFTITANKLTAYVITWERQFTTGSVTLGDAKYSYDATIRMTASVPEVKEVSSPSELPDYLLAAYEQQNPDYKPNGNGTTTSTGYSEVDVVNHCADGHDVDIYLDDGSGVPQFSDTLSPGDTKPLSLTSDKATYRVIAVDSTFAGCNGSDAPTKSSCQRKVISVLCDISGGTTTLGID